MTELLQVAQFVAIRMRRSNYLHICEVQVFGIPVADLPEEGFIFGEIFIP